MKKKLYVTLLATTTLLGTLAIPGTSVYANSQDVQERTAPVSITPITSDSPITNEDYEIQPQPRLLGSVAVFVGGIFVGYIVDGVIIYATGVSVSQHIANGMMAAQRWYYRNRFGTNYSSVHVVNGAVFGGNSRPF